MSPATRRFLSVPARPSALKAAKALLESSRDKTWQQLISPYLPTILGRPYCERLTERELERSAMSYRDSIRIYRSRSVDLGFLSRESYLAQWNRERTPVHNQERYMSHLRRSFTPVREIAGVESIPDRRHPLTSYRARTPLAMVTAPYHTNIQYRAEDQPFRKYDIFGLRTWSYPIYKYIYGRDQDYRRPYSYNSFNRVYGTTSLYTPPQLTPESRPITTRRGYSGYTYLANETNYDIASQPRSLKNYMYTRTYVGTVSAPPYWSYYGNSSLRHFNSYRPNIYTPSTAIWHRYF
ncbi:hypothetical protein Aduo_010271 [Ancylostoma duodenale]